MAMNHIRGPSEFSDSFYSTFAKKDHPVLVVIIQLSCLVLKHELPLEELLVVEEIHL